MLRLIGSNQRSNEWECNYSLSNTKEQNDDLEQTRQEIMATLNEAKNELTTRIQSNASQWANWAQHHVHDLHPYYMQMKERMYVEDLSRSDK